MNKITVISGGARSGKSSFGEKLALESQKKVLYIATAIAFDEGMKERIKRHRTDRPKCFETVEMYKDFKSLKNRSEYDTAEVILLDCLTLLVTNHMLESGLDFEIAKTEEIEVLEKSILNEIELILNLAIKDGKEIIIVTNEVGLGIVPDNKLGALFRDIAGRVNQYVASKADSAYIVFLGLPLKLK